MILIRVCAWCDKYLGFEECEGALVANVTHGICDQCAKREYMAVGGLGVVRLADEAQVAAGKAEELALYAPIEGGAPEGGA